MATFNEIMKVGMIKEELLSVFNEKLKENKVLALAGLAFFIANTLITLHHVDRMMGNNETLGGFVKALNIHLIDHNLEMIIVSHEENKK
jgi:hypothetical protein